MAGNTRSAPVGDRLRKAQVNTDCRPLKTMVALFRVRLRGALRLSEIGCVMRDLVGALFISSA